jgi:predicted nucleotidyltransferase
MAAIEMSYIHIDRDRIADFCRRHHIRRLSLFGSVLRDDFGPDSDVDVLVEFDPGHTPGLAFFSMEEELSRIMGRKVDLNTPGFLSPYLRDRIEKESEVQYVTA